MVIAGSGCVVGLQLITLWQLAGLRNDLREFLYENSVSQR